MRTAASGRGKARWRSLPVDGRKSVRRILGVEPGLDRVARERELLLALRQGLAPGDPELPLDQVGAGHELGHRMLDLEAGVHLHEVEALRVEPVRDVGDELDRAGADIADRRGRAHRGRPHRGAHRRRHAGRRRLLDHFLMAPLQRAVALEQMDRLAVPVGEHLDLDVARHLEVALEQHPVVAEARGRLAPGVLQRGGELPLAAHHPHALAAAAGARLDQHGPADRRGVPGERSPGPGRRHGSPAPPARPPASISRLA